MHNGVPTATTPTLTPTTLRNIEQTFFEQQQAYLDLQTKRTEPHFNEAGFVPPPLDPVSHSIDTVDSKNWIGGVTTTIATKPQDAIPPSYMETTVQRCLSTSPPSIQPLSSPPRRNVGGRRPAKSAGISAEEEERRRIRRERNKLAAARCRKRRVDHTNELVMETEKLEQEKLNFQRQIQKLKQEKEKLEFLLEGHLPQCRLQSASPFDAKPLPFHAEPKVVVITQPRCDAATLSCQPSNLRRPQLGATAGGTRPSRPSSLPVTSKPMEIAGIPITTPSGVILNFDSMMEGGTGLTPVGLTPSGKDGLSPLIPSCSSQQRGSGPDVSSPDSYYPPKLVSL